MNELFVLLIFNIFLYNVIRICKCFNNKKKLNKIKKVVLI